MHPGCPVCPPWSPGTPNQPPFRGMEVTDSEDPQSPVLLSPPIPHYCADPMPVNSSDDSHRSQASQERCGTCHGPCEGKTLKGKGPWNLHPTSNAPEQVQEPHEVHSQTSGPRSSPESSFLCLPRLLCRQRPLLPFRKNSLKEDFRRRYFAAEISNQPLVWDLYH